MSSRRQCLVAALAVAAATVILAGSAAAEDLRARTRDGREVILREDGTWEFAPKTAEKKESTEAIEAVTRPEKATLAYEGKLGGMSLWLVPGKWRKMSKPTNPAAEVQYQFVGQDISAVVIHEDLEFGLEELTDIAVQNLEEGLVDVEILQRDHRRVNGQEMIVLRAVGKIGKAEIMFCGHYASGDFGSLQVFVVVPQKHFAKHEADVEALLAGVVVKANGDEVEKDNAVKTEDKNESKKEE